MLFCGVFYISPGVIMVGFVFGSKRFGFNPDNMATPMAASFGDLLTLALLAGSSFFSYSNIGNNDEDRHIKLSLLKKCFFKKKEIKTITG